MELVFGSYLPQPPHRVQPIPLIVPSVGSHFSNLVYGHWRTGSINLWIIILELKNHNPTNATRNIKQYTVFILLKLKTRRMPSPDKILNTLPIIIFCRTVFLGWCYQFFFQFLLLTLVLRSYGKIVVLTALYQVLFSMKKTIQGCPCLISLTYY